MEQIKDNAKVRIEWSTTVVEYYDEEVTVDAIRAALKAQFPDNNEVKKLVEDATSVDQLIQLVHHSPGCLREFETKSQEEEVKEREVNNVFLNGVT